MKALRLLTAGLFAVALVPLAEGAASAAPPGNDESTGAVVLHLGDQIHQVTTEATTNAGDDALNANCGAPFTNASVWYKYSPTVDHNVVLDTTASDYSAGLMVFRGIPAPDRIKACGPGAVGLRARAGATYYIMAFSDTEEIGGNLVLTATSAPTPRVHATVAKGGVATHGAARIHGSYRCLHGENLSELDAHLMQRAGRLKIPADSGTRIQCDGQRHRWSVKLVSPIGTYAAGRARVRIMIIACGVLTCRHETVRRHIHLVAASGPQRPWMTRPTTGRTERAIPKVWVQRTWPS